VHKPFKIIKRFARVLRLDALANDVTITVVPVGGFSQWRRIEDAAWTFETILRSEIRIMALFDRDYRCNEEIEGFLERMRRAVPRCFVLERKEIENYLLVPSAMARALTERLRDRGLEAEPLEVLENYVRATLAKCSEDFKANVVGQLSASMVRFYSGRTKKDDATIVGESVRLLEQQWPDIESRLAILPGKQLLSQFNQVVQDEKAVMLSHAAIVRHMARSDIPDEFVEILQAFDELARLGS
jgi:hypothetical protein